MTVKSVPQDRGVIIFDGYCILCSNLVAILAKIDRRQKFYYTTFYSDTWKKLSIDYTPDYTPETDSIVLLMDKRIYLQSDAIIAILKELAFPWSILAVLKYVPFRIREKAYQFIAKYRYRIFGKKDTCGIPAEKVYNRLLH